MSYTSILLILNVNHDTNNGTLHITHRRKQPTTTSKEHFSLAPLISPSLSLSLHSSLPSVLCLLLPDLFHPIAPHPPTPLFPFPLGRVFPASLLALISHLPQEYPDLNPATTADKAIWPGLRGPAIMDELFRRGLAGSPLGGGYGAEVERGEPVAAMFSSKL